MTAPFQRPPERASKPSSSRPSLSLKGRALRLLSQREHSRAELQQKLRSYEETQGELTRILDELTAKDFINEQRVIESVLHRRAAKLGGLRIQQELLGKGLAPDAVQAALADLRGTETERARAVWAKKFKTAPQDAAERGKQMRFLASRGFGAEAISRVLAGSSVDD